MNGAASTPAEASPGWCEVCLKDMQTLVALEEHRRGKKHLRKAVGDRKARLIHERVQALSESERHNVLRGERSLLGIATRLRRAPARRAERVDGVAQLGRVLALPRVVVGTENLEEGLDVVLVVEQVAVAARALVPVSGGNRISGARLVPTYTRLLDGVKLDEGLVTAPVSVHEVILCRVTACRESLRCSLLGSFR